MASFSACEGGGEGGRAGAGSASVCFLGRISRQFSRSGLFVQSPSERPVAAARPLLAGNRGGLEMFCSWPWPGGRQATRGDRDMLGTTTHHHHHHQPATACLNFKTDHKEEGGLRRREGTRVRMNTQDTGLLSKFIFWYEYTFLQRALCKGTRLKVAQIQ